jgi:hypothetical protein
MQEKYFKDLVGCLSHLIEVLSIDPEESDPFLLSLWRDAAVFSFLRATWALRSFLAEVFRDKTLLQEDLEGFNRLENALTAFMQRGIITQDQFKQMGSLIYDSLVLSRDRNNIPREIYLKKVDQLVEHCDLLASLCEKIVLHSCEGENYES